MDAMPFAHDAKCDFCGKTQAQARAMGVGGLVAGRGGASGGSLDKPPDAHICGECARLVVQIVEEEGRTA